MAGAAELELEVMDIDLQVNGDDCGLHAIATVYELCAGNDPTGITTNLVWGGHYFCLNIMGKFSVGGTLFFPFIEGEIWK